MESSCFRNPPALRHQKFTGLPPPPRESKSNSCAFGSGTVTFQGGSFQEKTPGLIGPRSLRILIRRIAVGWPCMECHVPCHISKYWVWDSVKQSEGWGKNPALIARSPTRHSNILLKNFITNRLCWFGSLNHHYYCLSLLGFSARDGIPQRAPRQCVAEPSRSPHLSPQTCKAQAGKVSGGVTVLSRKCD